MNDVRPTITELLVDGFIVFYDSISYHRADYYKVMKPFTAWGKTYAYNDIITVEMGEIQ